MVSKIVNGNIETLSIEFLIKLMVRAGLSVSIQQLSCRTWPPPALWRASSATPAPQALSTQPLEARA
jgi:hypothetical protein